MNDVDAARRRWEAENSVESVDTEHARYRYDREKMLAMTKKQPWKTDPNYFKHVHISAMALIKIVMHAKSGGRLEVMGSLIGKVEENEFVVMDSFPLPVEGTEVRVEALETGDAFQVNFLSTGQEVNRPENCIGWYHSHPDYGCWLSGIDVDTQRKHQKFNEPWLAIVVDPLRTMSSGKVDIGAFRTYNDEYKPGGQVSSKQQAIPQNRGLRSPPLEILPTAKIADYGHHHWKYYRLEISCFKSRLESHLLESVWNRFWASTLSTSPLLEDRAQVTQQINDLSNKIRLAHKDHQDSSGYVLPDNSGPDSEMQIIAQGQKVANEQMRGLMTLLVKNTLFNS